MKLKERLMKTKGNRIYIQDKELSMSNFKVGQNYKYIFDFSSNSLLIVPDDKGRMKVSKRVREESINPVIDIRSQDALGHFSQYDCLELAIYEDKIIVKGLEKEDNLNVKSTKKIIDFTQRLKVKEEIVLRRQSAEELLNKLYNGNYKKVVNGSFINSYQQISFDELFNDVETSSKVKKDIELAFKVVSLCSGAGVLDKGFKDQGFDIVYAMDIEKDMVETYRYNLGDHVHHGDMSTLKAEDLPSAQILIAGTPCQDLSNANRQTGKILDSPKNLLIRKFIEIVNGMKDLKVFVLENVPQLLTKGEKFLDELKEKLNSFDVTVNLVTASDFGSAQKRERAIIIGSKIGKIELVPPKIKLIKTVRQALAGLNDSIPNQLDYSKPRPDTLEKIKHIPEGGNFKDLPDHLKGNYSEKTHSCILKRINYDEPSITIANVRKSNILHPDANVHRQLSVRECARLFDLPDTFVFKGNLASKQQMIANAVPLALSTAIAKAVKEAIELFNQKLKVETATI